MKKAFYFLLLISGIGYGQAREGETVNQWLERIHEEAEAPVVYKRGDEFTNYDGEIITLKKKVVFLDGVVMWKVKKTNWTGGRSVLYYLETDIKKLQPVKESVIYKLKTDE